MIRSCALALLLAASSVPLTAAHMEMIWPPPFRSRVNPFTAPGMTDYSMTNPLRMDGSDYPCKGYLVDMDRGRPGDVTATLMAGQRSNVTLDGGARHGGGSCQISLSYDHGRSFTVLQSYEGGCPLVSTTLDFSIPADAPRGDAVLAWTWFNQIGNREMYMNCAHITVAGGSGSGGADQPRRTSAVSMSARPDLFVANIGNGCKTVEGTDVVFPHPGPDVTITGASGLSPPRGSSCQQSKQKQRRDGVHDESFGNTQVPAAESPAVESTTQARREWQA